MIDAYINKASGSIVESIESQYINISAYRPLSGSSYINLPVELRSQKYFLWCHVRHINPSKEHPDIMKITDKKLLKNLIMVKLSFLFKENILAKLRRETIFASMFLVTKMDWFFRFLF